MLATSSSHGVEFLPDEYDLRFERAIEDIVSRHYAGYFRQGFVLEGLAYLLNEQRFEAQWHTFAQTHAS